MALDRSADDLDRLFRHLVYTLVERRPGRLEASVQVSELYQEIVPYRLARSPCRFDTNEDYEMALLRLLAGVKGYAILEPSEAQAVLALEADAMNPFPGAFRDFAAARVRLNAAAVRSVLAGRASYAPAAPPDDAPPAIPDASHGMAEPPAVEGEALPDEAAEPAVPAYPAGNDPPRRLPYTLDGASDAPAQCSACGRSLPRGRVVAYCPFCGATMSRARCPKCDTAFEMDWTYCIACRHPLHPS